LVRFARRMRTPCQSIRERIVSTFRWRTSTDIRSSGFMSRRLQRDNET
jgi:hypothetical protein